MGKQSTTKTLFLLASMIGWLIVGAALMYLFPWFADRLVASDVTHQWMQTLGRSGYNPWLGGVGGGVTLTVLTLATVVWYRWFDGKV